MIGIRIICFVLLFGLLGCNGESKDKTIPVIRQDREFDKVKLTDLKRRPIELKQYGGKQFSSTFGRHGANPALKKCHLLKKCKIS